MLLDKQLAFSFATAVTVTAISDVIDTQATLNPLKDLGAGDDVFLYISVPTTVTAAGAATVTITLESDSTANLATAPVVHLSTIAIPKATLVAGYEVLKVVLPRDSYKRFVGIRYTVATGPLTAGAFTAVLAGDTPATRSYINNYLLA